MGAARHLGPGGNTTLGLLPLSTWPSPLPRAAVAEDALAAGDDGRAAGLLGPDVTFFEAPGTPFARADGPSHGGDEAVRHMLAPLGAGTTGWEVVTHELLGCGSAIVALGSFRSRATGGEPGPVLPYAHIWMSDRAAPLEIRQHAAWLPLAGPRH